MAGTNPLHQFELQRLAEFQVGGVDLSFTNSSLFMLIAVALCGILYMLALGRAQVVPGRAQLLAEKFHDTIAGMVGQMAGDKSRAYFPFIFCMFLFIMACNLLGVLPHGFTVTSHFIINIALALAVFVMVIVTGFVRHGAHFLSLFVPSGTPWWLLPIIFVLEFVSFCVRPITLTIRLFANMLAGGILLKSFAGLAGAFAMGGALTMAVGAVPFFALTVGLFGLKVFVAGLQAYIFCVLTAVYLHDALEMH
ncbi:MAG: F0F1 ATP synthase subunit A [Alphaproteobacteria bacterium]|nr:F0F1 ATP synthase subunit A [Alphaproteobacteria bacterium]